VKCLCGARAPTAAATGCERWATTPMDVPRGRRGRTTVEASVGREESRTWESNPRPFVTTPPGDSVSGGGKSLLPDPSPPPPGLSLWEPLLTALKEGKKTLKREGENTRKKSAGAVR